MVTEPQRLDLAIEGMTCSACSARLERVLGATEGVLDATVNLAIERAMIRIDPIRSSLQAVIDKVRRCGFDVGIESTAYHVDNLADAAEPVEKALRAIPGVLDVKVYPNLERIKVTSAALMASDADLIAGARAAGHAMFIESGKDGQAERAHQQTVREQMEIAAAVLLTAPFLVQMTTMFGDGEMFLGPWMELALATPVQFVLGLRFYRGAINSLRGGGANMDVLVAMGTTAAFGFSVYQLIVGEGHLYFEASAVIITLVMVGKHLEARAKRGASAAIQELLALRPDTALVRLPDGEVEERSCSQIVVGDVVVSRPGDQVATDGVIVRGEADLDESVITGESRPVPKGVGDPVTAGSINVDGFLEIETTAVGEDSTLAKMIHLVENAQAGKPAVQRLVDRVSAVFVPVVVGIAAVTLIGWMVAGYGFEQALISAAATLVIACPCALGLATPTAIMTGSSVAAKAGILIKDITTLEQAHTLTHVVFDKTGTLTEGKPTLAEVELLAGLDEDEVLRVAASLQQGSEHPIALAFREAVEKRGLKLADVENFRNIVSRGIEGDIDGVRYLVGNDRLFLDKNLDPPPRELQRGGTEIWLGANLVGAEALLARFELVDELRPTAKAAVDELKRLNVEPLLVSGDAVSVARHIGADLGIEPENVHGEARPENKSEIIARLTAGGAKVGMVGDGVNDAPALAQATVGIALGTGTDVAMETAGVTLMRPDPRLVASAIDISRRTFRKIRQNLFWAFLYNVVGLPLAAFGELQPTVAAAAMALSSISVVSSSLTLRFWKPRVSPIQ